MPFIDPPVGPYSNPGEIHTWLDELQLLRAKHQDDSAAVEVIDQEIARAVGWLHGRDDLSGAGV